MDVYGVLTVHRVWWLAAGDAHARLAAGEAEQGHRCVQVCPLPGLHGLHMCTLVPASLGWQSLPQNVHEADTGKCCRQ